MTESGTCDHVTVPETDRGRYMQTSSAHACQRALSEHDVTNDICRIGVYVLIRKYNRHLNTVKPACHNISNIVRSSAHNEKKLLQNGHNGVKVIGQKGRIAAAYGRFSGSRQVEPVCTEPNTFFLGPTRLTTVHNPNGISIGSAVFAGLTVVTNRQTDRPTNRQIQIHRKFLKRYSLCNRPHLRT